MTFPGNLKREPLTARDNTVTMPWLLFFQQMAGVAGGNLIITFHAARPNYPARNYPDGTWLYETDRNALYADVQRQWVLVSGQMSGTLSPDEKPSDLGEADAGMQFNSTDFLRRFVWNGSAWERYDLEVTGEIRWFPSDPGTGFVLADGATVTVTNDDGTLNTGYVTKNLIGYYIKGANAWANGVPEVPGTVTGTTSAVSAGTPSGTISGVSASLSAGTTVQSGVGATVASTGHDHPAPTFSGSSLGTHSHTASGTSTGAEPPHAELIPYQRC